MSSVYWAKVVLAKCGSAKHKTLQVSSTLNATKKTVQVALTDLLAGVAQKARKVCPTLPSRRLKNLQPIGKDKIYSKNCR